MSSNPPSPDGSTGITILTLGSALTETSLTAPVVRSATNADWLSGCMIKPLVLSRQPCMTPGAGHCLGKGFGGNGGGGGGGDVGPGASSGFVVNGWDCALSKRAHPDTTSNAAHITASALGNVPRSVMPARLLIFRVCPPRRALQ